MKKKTQGVQIPYSKQVIDKADISAVVKALKSPFLTQGPAIKEFEDAVCKWTGAKYCVAFNSGTGALHGAYEAAGVGPGDEVIMSPLTFAATGNMVLALGARPVFADINPETGNLDPAEAEKKITSKTKAIVAIDYAGLPVDIDAFRVLAAKHNIVFIEDSAQGFGGAYKGKQVGWQADMTMFSFHPVKSITTGEGGVITTNNKQYFERMRSFRSHGLVREKTKLRHPEFAEWHQEVQLLGFNYRITDIQAALGTSQLKKLRKFISARSQLADRYDALLSGLPLTLPARVKKSESAWHLYVIRVPQEKRDSIFRELRSRGLWVQVHYLPVYWHPLYADLGYERGQCPNAEKFCMSCISIPLFPTLSKKEQQFVVNTLADILK